MPRSPTVAEESIVCTQLITRFDRNADRPITLAVLRQVRRHIARDMGAAGADGSSVWRLTRTPSGRNHDRLLAARSGRQDCRWPA